MVLTRSRASLPPSKPGAGLARALRTSPVASPSQRGASGSYGASGRRAASSSKEKKTKNKKIKNKKTNKKTESKISKGKRWTDKQLIERFTKVGESGAYTSADKLARALGIDRDRVDRALAGSKSVQLHKKTVRRFPRRRTLALPFHFLTADLQDVSRLKEHNDGVRFLLYAIDMGSRYLRVKPLKNKTAQEVTRAMKEIFEDMERESAAKGITAGVSSRRGLTPRAVRADQGREFDNKTLRRYLEGRHVNLYTTKDSQIKSSQAERIIRTLSQMLQRYMTRENTLEYLPVLPSMVETYNKTFHSALGMSPSEVTVDDSHRLWMRQHWKNRRAPAGSMGAPRRKPKEPRFKVGQTVFLARDKMLFEKGSSKNFRGEAFVVARVIDSTPPTFVIADMAGELLAGSFYAQELISAPLGQYHEVERVLDTRRRKGRTEYLVRWLHYPAKFDSWVSEITPYKTESDLNPKSK